MKTVTEAGVLALLKENRSFVLTAHVSPDGDCLRRDLRAPLKQKIDFLLKEPVHRLLLPLSSVLLIPLNLIEKCLNMRTVLERFVNLKRQFGIETQTDAFADLTAHKSECLIKTDPAGFVLLFRAHQADIYLGTSEVACDSDLRDRYHTIFDARIFYIIQDDLADLLHDEFLYFFYS